MTEKEQFMKVTRGMDSETLSNLMKGLRGVPQESSKAMTKKLAAGIMTGEEKAAFLKVTAGMDAETRSAVVKTTGGMSKKPAEELLTLTSTGIARVTTKAKAAPPAVTINATGGGGREGR